MAESKVYNECCLEGMKRFPDKYFELAIVDPPYGIGIDGAIHIRKPDRPSTWDMVEKYERKEWDSKIPDANYWNELFRVSKNQIVWGGNYFTEFLRPSKGWVFWDKQFENTFNFSHGELAWTSFNMQLLKVTKSSKSETNGGKDRIHPTQKPVAIYRWLLHNYAKAGDKILDTHMGSQSSRIAAYQMGFDYTGFEIDREYFEAGNKRFKLVTGENRMENKLKAKQLVERFTRKIESAIDPYCSSVELEAYEAAGKESALIACDEIITLLDEIYTQETVMAANEYRELKKEIEQL